MDKSDYIESASSSGAAPSSMTEGQLADNVQTIRECGSKLNADVCNSAFNEVRNFMNQDGPLQSALRERNLITTDGNSLIISPMVYPSDNSKK